MYTVGRNIVISGGSRGLGLHLAQRFLEYGNRVITYARTRTQQVESLSTRYPEQFHFSEINSSIATEVGQFFSAAVEKFGQIDVVINNAAIAQDALLVHTDVDAVTKIIQTNIVGPTVLTRAAVRHMMLNGRGHICSISSICSSRGFSGLTVYAGSKGYIDALTRSLAREVGQAGIYVNCVAPGFFDSEMSSSLLNEQLTTIKRRTPSQSLSQEENVFKVVDLLVSGNSNIQGQVISIDGGYSV